MSPGAGLPGKERIFDHPIVKAIDIKPSTPLGHDLPTMSLPARSSASDSASFRAKEESFGGASSKMSTGSGFNPGPDLHVAAPPRDSYLPTVTAAPAEQKVLPPVPDQRVPESSASAMSSLVAGVRNLGEHVAEVEPMAECPGGEAAYRAACRETDKEIGEALSEAGKKCANFVEEHPVLTTVGGMVAAEVLVPVEGIGAAKTAYDTVSGAVKAFSEALKSSGPGGLTFATAGGPTLSGALEAAPAAAGIAEGIGIGTVTAATAASDVPLSFARKADGRDRTPEAGPAPKEWIRRTPEDVKGHLKQLKENGNWRFNKEDKTYVNKTTGEKRRADYLHNEIECNKGDKAWVIDPVTGETLDKKGHLLE